MNQIIRLPPKKPHAPPRKANQPTRELGMPIASSIPWTGKGECTSQRVYPAWRTLRAADMAAAGVSNSARIP